MANLWFKFYGTEYLSDQKIERLNPVERSCWVTLLCLASANETGEIRHLTVQVLLNKSGVQFDPYRPELWEEALGIFEKLEMLEMIERTDVGTIFIKNWNKRQEHNLTVAERVAKSRANKKSSTSVTQNVTNVTQDVTSDVTNVTTEENRIEKNRIEDTSVVKESRESKKVRLAEEYESSFQEFWKIYPEKVAKGKAYEVWKLLTDEIKQTCISAIKNQVENNHFYKEWKKEDVPPHPTTWLNQRRWEDTVKQITKPEQLKVITV